jgi:cytochrome c oxidase subunit 2
MSRRSHCRIRLLYGAFALLAAVAPGAGRADAAELVMAPEPFRYCAVCHGVELVGNRAVDAPKLAGLPAWYLSRQMDAFRRGWRGMHDADFTGMEMRPQATVLTEAQLASAVRYAASVPTSPATATVTGDAGRGAMLYQPCAACHGGRGEGNEALLSPPLAGQSDWYLVTQLEHFRSGARGTMPGDTQGALMRASATTVPDADAVADVVAYINTLDDPSAKERETQP